MQEHNPAEFKENILKSGMQKTELMKSRKDRALAQGLKRFPFFVYFAIPIFVGFDVDTEWSAPKAADMM